MSASGGIEAEATAEIVLLRPRLLYWAWSGGPPMVGTSPMAEFPGTHPGQVENMPSGPRNSIIQAFPLAGNALSKISHQTHSLPLLKTISKLISKCTECLEDPL